MSWVEGIKDRGGRLVPAAVGFAHSQGAHELIRGADGVRWLAECIERFLDGEVSPTDDHQFVEGAGAFLALILIEHLGGCARTQDGAYRVQLGSYGWFDPFAAITQTLDAENPRRCLSECLAVAEREARQTGPISRIVSLFADVLADERPDVRITSQLELTVELDNGASIDLARLEKVSRGQDEEAAVEAARRLVSMLPGDHAPRETNWAEAATRLFPRLVSKGFLETLPNEDALYREEIGHDVRVALQLRYGTRARYVRRTEVDQWRSCGNPFHRAVRNLAARSRSLGLESVGDMLRVRRGDGLDGTRLILPDLAVRLRQLAAGAWIAAAPHRDVLLMAPADRAALLAHHAKDAAERAPHPISAALFAVTDDGLSPVSPAICERHA